MVIITVVVVIGGGGGGLLEEKKYPNAVLNETREIFHYLPFSRYLRSTHSSLMVRTGNAPTLTNHIRFISVQPVADKQINKYDNIIILVPIF